MILWIVQPLRNLILWGRCWLIWLLTPHFPPTSRSACTALHNPNAIGFEGASPLMMLPRSWLSGPVLFLAIKNSGNMFGQSLVTTNSTIDCIDMTRLVPTNRPAKRLRKRPSTRRALPDLFGVPKEIWVIFVHQLQNLRKARKHYQAWGLECIVCQCVFFHQIRKDPDHQYAHKLLKKTAKVLRPKVQWPFQDLHGTCIHVLVFFRFLSFLSPFSQSFIHSTFFSTCFAFDYFNKHDDAHLLLLCSLKS